MANRLCPRYSQSVTVNTISGYRRRAITPGNLSQHQRRILRSKGNAVAHPMLDRLLASCFGEAIESHSRPGLSRLNCKLSRMSPSPFDVNTELLASPGHS